MDALDLVRTPPHEVAHEYPALSVHPAEHTTPHTCRPAHTASLLAVHAAAMPCEQLVHEEHAATPVVNALKKPVVHAVHAADVPAPVTLPYLPTTHAVHALVPEVRSLYPPAAHPVHTLPEVAPALLLYRPCTQAVQPEATESALYVPVLHEVHTKDVSEATTAPYAPAPQAVHADADDCEL